MSLHHVSPPQGFSSEQSQNIIGRSILPLYSPPQSREVGPPAEDDEIIQEVAGVIDHLLYDEGTDSGFVLIEETV